ncbi:uncharacterized protein B0T15DRAFT_401491 [Chaetomium strumarium]|uniref:BZIP domain-containing protein n=1 Tax=Chaetomium strumarium TaxID=1170767 RepID=A0AAJ0GP96_9PEZI|nr:hypothetical protein B0T15DRAFT_401491 [Chaetomium strumarium]
MRYSHGDLAILSAEVYNDSPASGPLTRRVAARRSRPSPPSSSTSPGPEEGPRKRAKTGPTGPAEPEEEQKKRSRGRPRLDTKDETAADRRRTQIRLAQRAYRNRKENAIQTLEQRVQQLKDTNEEMSNAFMQLHDFALSNGLLDRIPEFGSQLRATTERFLSLAREASDDDAKDGDPKSDASNKHPECRPGSDGIQSTNSPPQSDNAPPTVTTAPGEKPTLFGGLIISSEPTDFGSMTAAVPISLSQQLPPSPTSNFNQYEVVTLPTPENASFSTFLSFPPDFGNSNNNTTSLESVFDQQNNQQQHLRPTSRTTAAPLAPPPPPSSSTSTSTSSPSPWNYAPPLPNTYAHTLESTFGRRLQRYTLERAFVLISLPHPPEHVVSRVFGFCLLFESRAAIRRRLRRVLGHDAQQNLSNWQFPFFHLGGAGRHSFVDVSSSPSTTAGMGMGMGMGGMRVGNQGTRDVLKPGQTAGFGAGPFTENVSAVRDGRLDGDMRMELEGFGGEYFDCDEAEMYLYQRGVVIPPGRMSSPWIEFAATAGGGGGGGGGSGQSNHSPSGVSPASTSTTTPGSGAGGAPRSQQQQLQQGIILGNGWWNDPVDPTLPDMLSQGQAFTTMAESSSSAAAFAPASDGSGMLSFGDGSGGSGFGMGGPAQGPGRRRVIVDVMMLVQELTKRATCLGRTPGFRQKDINAAFWASVQVGIV